MARENLQLANELRAEKLAADAAVPRVRVSITSAASELARHVIKMIASGHVFAPAFKVNLTLCETDTSTLSAINLAYGSVDQPPVVTSDPDQFFTGADVILLLDDVTAGEGERRADWLRRVYDKFSVYARHIDAVCSREVVVVVAAVNSAANFVGTVLSRCAPGIPAQNVVVVSRLVEDGAAADISRRVGVNARSVVDLVVWGDASAANPSRFWLDVSRAKIYDSDTSAVWGPQHCRSVERLIQNRRWLHRDLPAILSSSSSSSSSAVISMATSVTSFLSDWWTGNCSSQRLHSLAVASQGSSHQYFVVAQSVSSYWFYACVYVCVITYCG